MHRFSPCILVPRGGPWTPSCAKRALEAGQGQKPLQQAEKAENTGGRMPNTKNGGKYSIGQQNANRKSS